MLIPGLVPWNRFFLIKTYKSNLKLYFEKDNLCFSRLISQINKEIWYPEIQTVCVHPVPFYRLICYVISGFGLLSIIPPFCSRSMSVVYLCQAALFISCWSILLCVYILHSSISSFCLGNFCRLTDYQELCYTSFA